MSTENLDRVVSDLILLFFMFKYADRPLRFFSKIAFALFTPVFITFLYYFFAGLSSGNIQSYISERPGFFTIAILGFMLGVQLVFTGLILEYIIYIIQVQSSVGCDDLIFF